MGQKVNPHGLRVGVIQEWDSRWYARSEKVGDLIVEDFNIRKYLKNKYYESGIPRIEIERDNSKVRVIIHCARPGMLVGRGGSEVEKIEQALSKLIGKPVKVSIIEERNSSLSAQLIAEDVALQLEKRVSFRRAMKQAMSRAMKLGAKGIKCNCNGRLGGAEIARSEHYHEGTIPLQTLRADIDYGFAEAKTTYGRIGIKVWLYKGEVLQGGPRTTQVEGPRRDRRNRDDRRNGQNGERRFNNNREGGQFNRNGRDNRQGGNRNFGERKPFTPGSRAPQNGQRPAFNPNRTPRTTKPEGGADNVNA